MSEAGGEPVCYLKGIDVTTLSKKDRRRLTRQAKKALQPPKPAGASGKKQKVMLTKDQRKEKFTALAVKAREKQQKREEKRGGSSYGRGYNETDDGPNADKLYCLGCRGKGHVIKDCKKSKPNTTGMCFNCGSTEHALRDCKERKDKSGKLPFAECFVCGQKGHISSQCSENEHGIYPKGGCCKICSSKFHLASKCPELGTSKDRFANSSSTEGAGPEPAAAGPRKSKRTVFADDDDDSNHPASKGGDAMGDKFDFEVPESAADTTTAAAEEPARKKAKKAKIVKF